MQDSCFAQAPEFIESDNRTKRILNPISMEQMHKKHEVLFPREAIEGKSILDLGCCLGATGHWCLENGATSYTGIEVQDTYAKKATELMQKYHPKNATIHHSPIEAWLDTDPNTYDIVSILGVLYVFTDYYSILKKISQKASELIVVESEWWNRETLGVDFCGVEFASEQNINLADENASLLGRGTRVSPRGLMWLMRDFGFHAPRGRIVPKPIHGSYDIYSEDPDMKEPLRRYLLHFVRLQKASKSLSENLGSAKIGERHEWKDPLYA